jgi:tetratricopeptide (TPR) repeat protein
VLLELSDPDKDFAGRGVDDDDGSHRYGRAPDVRGTLGESPLPHLLVHFIRRALTGTLVLRGPVGEDVRLYVRRGAPAKLASELTSSPLGEILVRMGALTSDELDDAVARARLIREPVGVHLVREGWIERAVLHAALRRQIFERLAAVQALPPHATFEFYAGEDLAADWRGEEPVPCDPLAALLTTVRAWREPDRIENSLSRLAGIPLRLHRSSTPARFGLIASERLVVDAIATFHPTLDTLRSLGLDAHAIRSSVYALAIARHLAFDAQPEPPLCVTSSAGVVEERVERRAPRRDPRSEDDVEDAAGTTPAASDETPAPPDATLGEAPSRPPATPSIVPRSFGPMQAAELARSLIPAAPVAAAREHDGGAEPEPQSAVERFLAAGDRYARAELALARGDFQSARREAQAAAEADPSRGEFRALATFARALGAPAFEQLLALQVLDRIMNEAPPSPRTTRYRAQLLHLLGRTAEAKYDYEAVLALDPGDDVAARGLASISAVLSRSARRAREGR